MKSTTGINSYNSNNNTTRFTPRQLIKYHIEHPEIPIRDEDIENLVLESPFISYRQAEDTLAKESRNFNYSN